MLTCSLMLTLVFFYVLPFNCSYECQCEWLLCPSVKYNHCNTVRKKLKRNLFKSLLSRLHYNIISRRTYKTVIIRNTL